MNVVLRLVLLNFVPVILVHLPTTFLRISGVDITGKSVAAQLLVLPVLLPVLNYVFYHKNGFTRFRTALGLMFSAMSLGAVWHLWNRMTFPYPPDWDMESAAVETLFAFMSPFVTLFIGLLAGAIFTITSRSEKGSKEPQPWYVPLLIIPLVSLTLSVSGYYLVGKVQDVRATEYRLGEHQRIYESKKPNIMALSNDPEEIRLAQYPVDIGYVFGEGPTSDLSRADVYLKDREVFFPYGYITKEDFAAGRRSFKTGMPPNSWHQVLVRTKNGNLYSVEFSSGNYSTYVLLWLRFQPGTL